MGCVFPKRQCRRPSRCGLPVPSESVWARRSTALLAGWSSAQRGEAGGGPPGGAVAHQSVPGTTTHGTSDVKGSASAISRCWFHPFIQFDSNYQAKTTKDDGHKQSETWSWPKISTAADFCQNIVPNTSVWGVAGLFLFALEQHKRKSNMTNSNRNKKTGETKLHVKIARNGFSSLLYLMFRHTCGR